MADQRDPSPRRLFHGGDGGANRVLQSEACELVMSGAPAGQVERDYGPIEMRNKGVPAGRPMAAAVDEHETGVARLTEHRDQSVSPRYRRSRSPCWSSAGSPAKAT